MQCIGQVWKPSDAKWEGRMVAWRLDSHDKEVLKVKVKHECECGQHFIKSADFIGM